MTLVRRDFHARAGDHVVQAAPGQVAVGGVALNREQDVPLCRIRMTRVDQLADHGEHVVNVSGCPRREIRIVVAECAHVVFIGSCIAFREFSDGGLLFGGGCHDLVVDVREVARVDHGGIPMAQDAVQNIENDGRARVANVNAVVDRGSADVHGHAVRVDRFEGAGAAGKGIVQCERHGRASVETGRARPRIGRR